MDITTMNTLSFIIIGSVTVFCGFFIILSESGALDKMAPWFKEMWKQHICDDFNDCHDPRCFDCNEPNCKGYCPIRKLNYLNASGVNMSEVNLDAIYERRGTV